MTKNKKNTMGRLFVVSAPTGGGKTTLVTKALTKLRKHFPIERIITYTTRSMRPGEKNTLDYIFVTLQEFTKLQSENYFIEITNYHNNMYGSPGTFINEMQDGKSFIAITDRNGIISYKKLYSDAICIWITPPSLEILAIRLKARGSETEDTLKKRLASAADELKAEQEAPLCSYHIVNDVQEKATQELIDIIKNSL
ncbi:guanylate kinase [Candidatus Dependentiae bacterium]|nr:guanylate kinase [Candidatus Dependentiae bacterium]